MLLHIGEDARLPATLFKLLRGMESQTYTREVFSELLHRPLHRSGSRVVQTGATLTVETSEYHKVLEIPMDDGRLFALQTLWSHTKALGFETIITGCIEDAFCR